MKPEITEKPEKYQKIVRNVEYQFLAIICVFLVCLILFPIFVYEFFALLLGRK